mmetsp:Transcript_24963/g.64415  ORF Transcript_24963/g.64415 Transcript_24963/m.64415 type:complete len:211 (+) Transcript_24963:116-748(+)
MCSVAARRRAAREGEREGRLLLRRLLLLVDSLSTEQRRDRLVRLLLARLGRVGLEDGRLLRELDLNVLEPLHHDLAVGLLVVLVLARQLGLVELDLLRGDRRHVHAQVLDAPAARHARLVGRCELVLRVEDDARLGEQILRLDVARDDVVHVGQLRNEQVEHEHRADQEEGDPQEDHHRPLRLVGCVLLHLEVGEREADARDDRHGEGLE